MIRPLACAVLVLAPTWAAQAEEAVDDDEAVLICDGCLEVDPEHDDAFFLPVDDRYTRAGLVRREREDSAR